MAAAKKKVVKKKPVKEVARIFPLVKSITVHKISSGENKGSWMCSIISTQDDKIINVEQGTPNIKPIVIDEAKIAFYNLFMKD